MRTRRTGVRDSTERTDLRLRRALGAATLAVGSLVVLILAFLIAGSRTALVDIGPARFAVDDGWHPTTGTGRFALGAMVCASLASTLGAVLLAAPLGCLAAVFLRFFAPRMLSVLLRGAVQLLAGIPSVVIGFFGLTRIVPWILAIAPPGQSLAAGILVLVLMIVPTVVLLVDATLGGVPAADLQAAEALGLSRWTTLTQVLRPHLLPGVGVAIVLAVMRAIGETMAVLMVAGNVVALPRSLFDPVRTLTANIALELGYATSAHRSVLFVSGLALMGVVLALVLLQTSLARRPQRA